MQGLIDSKPQVLDNIDPRFCYLEPETIKIGQGLSQCDLMLCRPNLISLIYLAHWGLARVLDITNLRGSGYSQ